MVFLQITLADPNVSRTLLFLFRFTQKKDRFLAEHHASGGVQSTAPIQTVVSALDDTGEVVVKEETVEPTHVESVRSSLQTLDQNLAKNTI